MANKLGFERDFRRYDDFYYNLSNLGTPPINLWNKLHIPGESAIIIQNNVLYCKEETELKPKEHRILTFSEAIKNLKDYVNEMKNEIKKRNEKDYEELETLFLYEYD